MVINGCVVDVLYMIIIYIFVIVTFMYVYLRVKNSLAVISLLKPYVNLKTYSYI